MSYKLVDSFRAGPGWNSVEFIMKLVYLVGFIIKKSVTMHGHMSRCTVTNVKSVEVTFHTVD
jgi:hypothetical protein